MVVAQLGFLETQPYMVVVKWLALQLVRSVEVVVWIQVKAPEHPVKT